MVIEVSRLHKGLIHKTKHYKLNLKHCDLTRGQEQAKTQGTSLSKNERELRYCRYMS